MSDITEEQKTAFLDDLTQLSRQHGIIVDWYYDCVHLKKDESRGKYAIGDEMENNGALMWIKPAPNPCPDGYKLVTSEEMERYKKPDDYQSRYRSGGTPWRNNPATDGIWMPELCNYAVRVDHVWELREVGK